MRIKGAAGDGGPFSCKYHTCYNTFVPVPPRTDYFHTPFQLMAKAPESKTVKSAPLKKVRSAEAHEQHQGADWISVKGCPYP